MGNRHRHLPLDGSQRAGIQARSGGPPPSYLVGEAVYVGDCQNYGPFWGPYYNTGPNTGPNLGNPKRDHDFDNSPCIVPQGRMHSMDFM